MPVDISLARIDMASARTEEEAFQKIHKHIKVVVEESVDQFTFILDEEMDLGKRIMIITELVKVLQLDIYINDLFPALVAQIDEKLARLARGEKIESPERDAWDRKNLPRHKEVFPELLAKTKDLKQELENTVKRLERNVSLMDTFRSLKPALCMTSHISDPV